MTTKYVVVIIALDGTVSACGPFPDEYRATLAANKLETEETGYTCTVTELERPADVLAEVASL